MTISICNIKVTSGSWDWTNQTLISSWHRRDNGRYPAEGNPPESYTIQYHSQKSHIYIVATKKLKLQAAFFKFFFKQRFSTLKHSRHTTTSMLNWRWIDAETTLCVYKEVTSNIVSENIYWERSTKMSPN